MQLSPPAVRRWAAWRCKSALTSKTLVMDMYLHDSADAFRFILRGDLTAAGARQLEGAWETAKSILEGKALTVEISGVTRADPAAIELLSRMRDSGARITAARPPECEDLLRFFGIPAAAPRDASATPPRSFAALFGERSRMRVVD